MAAYLPQSVQRPLILTLGLLHSPAPKPCKHLSLRTPPRAWWECVTTSNCIKITQNIISVLSDPINVLPNIFFQVFTLLQLLNGIIRNCSDLENAFLKDNTWLYCFHLILENKTFHGIYDPLKSVYSYLRSSLDFPNFLLCDKSYLVLIFHSGSFSLKVGEYLLPLSFSSCFFFKSYALL